MTCASIEKKVIAGTYRKVLPKLTLVWDARPWPCTSCDDVRVWPGDGLRTISRTDPHADRVFTSRPGVRLRDAVMVVRFALSTLMVLHFENGLTRGSTLPVLDSPSSLATSLARRMSVLRIGHSVGMGVLCRLSWKNKIARYNVHARPR